MPAPNHSKLKEKVRQLPETPGVYLMKDRLGSIIYVGKAKNLKRRVSSYFQASRKQRTEQPKVAAMLDLIFDFDTVEVRTDSEALLLEGRLIKEWKPRYNTDFTDDKRFLLVRIDILRPIPQFRLVRFRTGENYIYFGPFVHSTLLRQTLRELRQKFGILLGDTQPKQLSDGTWLLYDDARAEIYGHSNTVTADEYRLRVEQACEFLEGKSREWLANIEEQMQAAALSRDYEKAAEFRDILFALRTTIEKTRKFTRDPLIHDAPETVLRDLAQVLSLPSPPAVMECFDISHISGSFCVASMVRFVGGKPDRAGYRRFKIQSFTGNDDFRAMEEVVGRRYRRLDEENKNFPDLVVIDGGRGQIGAALKAFIGQGLEPPPIIGLAKKHETIIFPDEREPLRLPGNHPARLLLQRLRDEAHRFANTYNADLRRVKIRENILNDFPGLGNVRRTALLQHFQTITRLRAATPQEIAQVPGLGPKLAQQLHQFLQKQPTPP